MLKYALILTAALAVYWLTLSGYLDNQFLLTLGAISVLLVVGLCYRMRILDVETAPYQYLPKALAYFSWLFKEIVKANVQVARAVMSPEMEVSPTMVDVKDSPTADIGRTVFANSITLTPGTVSVEIDTQTILVHALLEEMSNPNDFVEMGLRSAWAMGEIKDWRTQI